MKDPMYLPVGSNDPHWSSGDIIVTKRHGHVQIVRTPHIKNMEGRFIK
jgi:hypothetical protein